MVRQVLGEILGEQTLEPEDAATATKQKQIFISYRSQLPDQTLAQTFYQALSAAGYRAFLAESSIKLALSGGITPTIFQAFKASP